MIRVLPPARPQNGVLKYPPAAGPQVTRKSGPWQSSMSAVARTGWLVYSSQRLVDLAQRSQISASFWAGVGSPEGSPSVVKSMLNRSARTAAWSGRYKELGQAEAASTWGGLHLRSGVQAGVIPRGERTASGCLAPIQQGEPRVPRNLRPVPARDRPMPSWRGAGTSCKPTRRRSCRHACRRRDRHSGSTGRLVLRHGRRDHASARRIAGTVPPPCSHTPRPAAVRPDAERARGARDTGNHRRDPTTGTGRRSRRDGSTAY
jgi:hypothetical protein